MTISKGKLALTLLVVAISTCGFTSASGSTFTTETLATNQDWEVAHIITDDFQMCSARTPLASGGVRPTFQFGISKDKDGTLNVSYSVSDLNNAITETIYTQSFMNIDGRRFQRPAGWNGRVAVVQAYPPEDHSEGGLLDRLASGNSLDFSLPRLDLSWEFSLRGSRRSIETLILCVQNRLQINPVGPRER